MFKSQKKMQTSFAWYYTSYLKGYAIENAFLSQKSDDLWPTTENPDTELKKMQTTSFAWYYTSYLLP
jgi:hypothetical protein